MSDKNKKIKCVIFGCEQLTVDFMRFLHKQKSVGLALVVTCEFLEDRLYGYESVIQEGKKLKIPVVDCKSITEDLIKKVVSLKPDIIFSLFYRRILPPAIIKLPSLGCINVHPGKLPQYRGFSPAVRALLNGQKTFGITIHHMDQGLDTGDILIQKEYPIDANETGFELHIRSAKLCAQILKDNFHGIINKKFPPRKQKGRGSYYGAMSDSRLIEWKEKAANLRNIVRANARPYRCMYTFMLNKTFDINKVSVAYDSKRPVQSPGTIVEILKDGRIKVACGDGHLILEDYEAVPGFAKVEKSIYLRVGNSFGKAYF